MWRKRGHTPLQLKTLCRTISYDGSKVVKVLNEAVLNIEHSIVELIVVHKLVQLFYTNGKMWWSVLVVGFSSCIRTLEKGK